MNLIEIDIVNIVVLFLILWGFSGILCWVIGLAALGIRVVWNAYISPDYYDASIAWREFNDDFYDNYS